VAKAAKPVKPLKPAKPPKPNRKAQKSALGPPAPPGAPPAKGDRTWKARHWAVILAAPLLLVVGGAIAYAKLTEHAPMAKVPDVVDRDVFSAASILKSAGFEVDSVAADSSRPGGTILDQDPGNGKKLEQGSTVRLTVSRTRATVPYVVTMGLGDAKVTLAKRGFLNLTVTPDYRDDVDVGTVMRTNPGANLQADKSAAIEVVVAADPHVELRDVVGVDQRTATNLLQDDGLVVAVQTASSKTRPAGTVLKSSPGAGTTVVRGDTITITVSSGPKQVNVESTVGKSGDDAVSDLEDAGFAVQVATTPVSSSRQDGIVLAQSPAGGTAAEGSTVTVTVGARR
jgi:serine/threonine-protein kinase